MTTVFDVDPNLLIEATAKKLKEDSTIQPPEWSKFVKTGVHKQRQPYNDDWWYVRAAAILRTTYTSKKPIGVSKLRTKYGGKKYRGLRPGRFEKGSGSIARKILQQLQTGGYLKLQDKGVNKGRVIDSKGMKLLDGVAHQITPIKNGKTQTPEQETKAN